MIRTRRKGMSTRGITIIALIAIVFVAIGAGVFTVMALRSTTIPTSIAIRYVAEGIDGSVSVSYQLLSTDGKNDGEVVNLETIEFSASSNENPTQDVSPGKTLDLSTKQPYIEFTYVFKNAGDVDYTAVLTKENVTLNENIGFEYKYKEQNYTEENYGILVQGVSTEYSTVTYKVKMKVEDVGKNAGFEGIFKWNLKQFNSDDETEQKIIDQMSFSESSNGTYTATYNGAELVDNTLTITGQVGPIKVTSVGKITNLPLNAKVVIGEGITTIETDAFSGQNVIDITLPDSLENIGDGAFYITSLQSVTIPKSVTKIGIGAFAYCYKLTEFIVEEGNPIYSADGNCLIENGTTLLAGCQKSVIPNYITHIESRAFMGQTNLTSITIPKSVQTMASGVFSFSYNLEEIICEDGGVFTSDGNCLIKGTILYAGCKNSKIPNYVTEILESSFSGQMYLAEITIPDSVETIYSYAFASCKNLESLTLGSGLKTISTSAFNNIGIATLTIPSNVTYIGWSSFGDCRNLTEIYVLSTDENLIVHYGAFKGAVAKFYCCLSGPGANWNAEWQDSLTEIHWNYLP